MQNPPRVVATYALTLFALLVTAQALSAQGRGRVVGRILDAGTATPLVGAQVNLVEQPGAGAVAGMDGRYTIFNVPAGPVSVRVRMIGYQAKIVNGLLMPEGGILLQDVVLSAQIVEVEALTVAAGAEAGSVDAALEKQHSASSIVNAITAEQISKSPDGDAGQAVQRVSGVSVQDGKYVFVRGLGERYTTTSLNGARVPSPEPDRKVVPLDLFPSGLLEGITTSKTFVPDQPGDFSGASVNLQTREFPAGRAYSISTTGGLNAAITGRNGAFAPTTGSEWLASAGSARALPGPVAALPASPSPAQLNAAIASFRPVWQAQDGSGAMNRSFSGSIGGEDPVFGHLVGYIGSLTYATSAEVRRNEQRDVTIDGDGQPGGSLVLAQNVYRGSTTRGSVLWGGMFNLSSRVGVASKFAFNNTYTRSGDNEAVALGGMNEEFGTPLAITRLDYTARTVRSDQLTGAHLIGMRSNVDWQVTNSAVRRNEPDRSDYVQQGTLAANGTVTPTAWWGNGQSAYRSFSDLTESAWNLGLNWKYSFGEPGRGPSLKVGGNYRTADRQAASSAFGILNAALSDSERAQSPTQIFSTANINADKFFLQLDNQVGDYAARDRIAAGYVMLDLPIGTQARLIAGTRVEQADLRVTTSLPGTVAPTAAKLSNTDVLPSLALNLTLSATQNLRFSVSQTLSRPEYRELSGVAFRDIVGGLNVTGNPDLTRALIQNYDIRWEHYPRAGEVLSAGVFYKHFSDPIEKVLVATTGATELGYVNARSGRNYGVELELRKGLDFLGNGFAPFSVFSNVTLMNSRVRLGAADLGAGNSSGRPMLGQASYVVNSGMAWATGEWSATALYNVVGRRVVEGGTILLPDAYEEPRHMIDVSLRFPIVAGLEGRFDGKNLLDSPFRITQGTLASGVPNYRSRYTTGRIFQFGMTYRP